MMNVIDPAALQLIERALDAGALRHAAIAQNIANANVAGARALQVNFEAMLGGVQEDIAAGRAPQVADVPEPSVSFRPSDQAIALDEEMAALSSNSMQYQALLRALGRQLSLVSIAVNEGKR